MEMENNGKKWKQTIMKYIEIENNAKKESRES